MPEIRRDQQPDGKDHKHLAMFHVKQSFEAQQAQQRQEERLNRERAPRELKVLENSNVVPNPIRIARGQECADYRRRGKDTNTTYSFGISSPQSGQCQPTNPSPLSVAIFTGT